MPDNIKTLYQKNFAGNSFFHDNVIVLRNECNFFFHVDLKDFDNTVIRITFIPDENAPDNECAAPIAVVNDAINEADEQVFIVHLHLINSTNQA